MRSALVVLLSVAASPACADETGTATFTPLGDQANVPDRYKLAERRFDWRLTPHRDLPALNTEVFKLTYPSPVTSPTARARQIKSRLGTTEPHPWNSPSFMSA